MIFHQVKLIQNWMFQINNEQNLRKLLLSFLQSKKGIGNLTRVTKEIGNPESTARGWKNQFNKEVEEKLNEEGTSYKRRRQRESKYIKMEKEVLREILEKKEAKLIISLKDIKELAIRYAKILYPKGNFTASN